MHNANRLLYAVRLYKCIRIGRITWDDIVDLLEDWDEVVIRSEDDKQENRERLVSNRLTALIKERFSQEPDYQERVSFLLVLIFGTSCIPENVEVYIDSHLSGSWSVAA